jgi:hypothetical protein
MPEAPYPADTRAKGWRFELNYEQIDQSDTWDIAAEIPMAQHSLLMMWYVAWKQEPCGSLPGDESTVRAKCKVSPKAWALMRDVLMRGWWLADDGRLYHPTLTERVLEMLEYRRKTAERVANFKAKQREQRGGNTLPTGEQQGKNDTGTGTGTIVNTTEPSGSDAAGVAAVKRAKETDPEIIIFSYGVPLLVSAGSTDKAARSFLGGLRKVHGDEALIQGLRDCIKAKPVQPLEWLAKVLPPKPPAGKQSALEARNAATVAKLIAEDAHAAE